MGRSYMHTLIAGLSNLEMMQIPSDVPSLGALQHFALCIPVCGFELTSFNSPHVQLDCAWSNQQDGEVRHVCPCQSIPQMQHVALALVFALLSAASCQRSIPAKPLW